jgi:hypothetical protein
MSLNVEDLLKALDNENNTGVAGLTTSKIKKEKNMLPPQTKTKIPKKKTMFPRIVTSNM